MNCIVYKSFSDVLSVYLKTADHFFVNILLTYGKLKIGISFGRFENPPLYILNWMDDSICPK